MSLPLATCYLRSFAPCSATSWDSSSGLESIVRVDSANLSMDELQVLPQSHLQQLLRASGSLPPMRMDAATLPLSVLWDSLQVSARA